jgi:hypothetical protein
MIPEERTEYVKYRIEKAYQKADYEVVFDYDENSVLPLFQPVKEMLDQINQEKNAL